ncbi:MAG: cytochrome c-type biogenesis protein [Vibrio sp.]
MSKINRLQLKGNLWNLLLLTLVACFSVMVQASDANQTSSINYEPQRVEVFQFKNTQDEQRAFYLARQLRCPKCQNQNLMESNAAIAVDMKQQVFNMVDQGKSNEQVLQFMTDRFGEFVLYNPPFALKTTLLWGLPILFLLCLVYFSFKLSRRNL